MSNESSDRPILELRVAITTQDYDRLVKFYCLGLGIEPAAVWDNGGKALMLDMGKGSLEVFDELQAEIIDDLEVGKRVTGPIRFGFQVPDIQAAVERFVANGATLVHEPVLAPWGDRLARIQDPDGMQITLFELKK